MAKRSSKQLMKRIARWNYHIPKLTSKQQSWIGRVIVRWAFLEEQISTAMALLLRLDTRQTLGTFLPVRNFRARVAMLQGLIEQSDLTSTAAKELKPIVMEILRLYGIRNALAHRPWWADTEGHIYSFNLDPNSLPFHPAERWKVSELQKASRDIQNVIDRLQDFTGKHQPQLDALRDRFREQSPPKPSDPRSSAKARKRPPQSSQR